MTIEARKTERRGVLLGGGASSLPPAKGSKTSERLSALLSIALTVSTDHSSTTVMTVDEPIQCQLHCLSNEAAAAAAAPTTTTITTTTLGALVVGRLPDLQSGGYGFESQPGLLRTKVYSAFHHSGVGK